MDRIEEFNHVFFHQTQTLQVVTDVDGRIVDGNDAWGTLLGYSREEVLGRPLPDFVHPDDRPRSVAVTIPALKKGEMRDFENRYVARDGSTKWFSWTARRIGDNFFGMGREITGEKLKQTLFDRVMEQVSSRTGDRFLSELAVVLAREIGWDAVVIAKLNPAKTQATTMRFWLHGQFLPNVDYVLKGTPCEQVAQGQFCTYSEGVADLFPEDTMLREVDATAYMAQTIENSDGEPVGILAMLHSQAAPFLDLSERLIRLLAVRVGCEIERQEQEQRVRESEARYRFVTEHATDVIHKHSLAGTWTFVNPTCQKLTGYSPQEIVELRPVDMVHPEDKEIARDFLLRVLEPLGEAQTLCFRLRHKDGSFRWVESTAHAIRDPHTGLANEILAVTRDVSARVQAEEERRKSAYRQMLHVRQTPLGVIEMNTRGEIVEWNPAAERIFGWRRDEILGCHFKKIVAPDYRPKVDEIWQGLLEQRSGFRNMNDNLRADGQIIFCEWYNTPLVAADGSTIGIASLVHDLTERRRAEEVIENQRLQMVAASKMSSLGEMAAGIAHEINNPLAIIFGRADQLSALAARREATPEKVQQAAEKINTTAERIARIVSGLRFFARDGAQDPFDKKPLGQLIDDTLAFCQSRFHHHDIRVEVVGDPALSVECRAVQISQVLLNLLNNAFDAVQGLPDRWVRIETRDIGRKAEIRVTDSGPGIPPDIASRIMTPFFTTKDVGRGTGLGLSISKGIAESHKGTLELDRSNANTSFVLILPKTQGKTRSSARPHPKSGPNEQVTRS